MKKNILESKFLKEMMSTTSNMYRLGWDERNGGNISVIIDEYGCFQGILTLEDVIETLIGDEIVDEMDTVRDMQQLARDKWKKIAKKMQQ